MPAHGRSRDFMFHNHHILLQHFANHPVIRHLRGRFEVDAIRNRMNLPSKQWVATDLNASPHTGGHLGTYHKGFGDYLDKVEKSPGYAAALAGDTRELDEVVSDVNALVAAARYALANGHLFANTATGMTSEDANAANEQWFENWRQYAADNQTQIQQMQETVDQYLAAGRADAALHFPLLSPTSGLSMAERIEISKRFPEGSPISLQFTNVGPVPDLPGLVPPFVDTRLPGFIPPPLEGLNEPEGFTPSNPLLSYRLPGFPAVNPQGFGQLPPTTAAPSDPLVLQSDPHSGTALPFYENPLAGGSSVAQDALPWLAGAAAVGVAAPFIPAWMLTLGGIFALSRVATAEEGSAGASKGAATPGGGVLSIGTPVYNTLGNGLDVDNAARTSGTSATSTFGRQLGGASSIDPEAHASTFADRFGNWASTPDGSVSAADRPEAVPTPAARSVAPENIRRLTRVNESNAGSVFTSGTAPVPHLPSTEFNDRFGSWTVPTANGGPPQPSKPVGTFADEPSYLIPPPIFGVDGSGNPRDDAEEWFSRWIRPLLRPD